MIRRGASLFGRLIRLVYSWISLTHPGCSPKYPMVSAPPPELFIHSFIDFASVLPSLSPHIHAYTMLYATSCLHHLKNKYQGRRPTMSRTQGRLNLGGVNGMGANRSECLPHWNGQRGEVGGRVGSHLLHILGEKGNRSGK